MPKTKAKLVKPTWADVVKSIRHCKKVWRKFGSDDLSEEFREAMGNVENYTVHKDGKIFRHIEGGFKVPVTIADPENINVKLRGICSK